MGNGTCGGCALYEPHIEPGGHTVGFGFCLSLATKRAGGEFQRPITTVSSSAPECSHFRPVSLQTGDSSRLRAILDPPALPPGIKLERLIEIQAGKCLRQQDSLASLDGDATALEPERVRVCERQILAALDNPRFHGKVRLEFARTDRPSLVAWAVRLYPAGGEIRA